MREKKKKSVTKLSLFDRPISTGQVNEKFTLYDYFTFKNIVIAMGLAVFFTFVARAASLEAAFLSIVLFALFGVILFENSLRRKREDNLISKLEHMNYDYERLVREVARNRNSVELIRSKIAEAAGNAVKSYSKKMGKETIESRMFKEIAHHLSKINDENDGKISPEDIDEKIVFDIAIADKEKTLKGIDDFEIGKRLTDDQVLQLVNAAVKKDRVDLFMQPIVTLPQRKKRFYETFSRIRIMPEIYLPATRYIELAMKHDLMPIIDNLLLLRGLQEVLRSEGSDYHRAFFFNITSLTLNDQKFMGDLVEFISQNRMLAPQLIFELGQKDLATMSTDTASSLDGLAKLGCRFSMDQVKNLSFDFIYLKRWHIRFIKIPSPMLLSEMNKENGLIILKRVKSEMDHNGIDIIVEKIETERQLLDLLDIDIDYGQGYLFGRPVFCEKR